MSAKTTDSTNGSGSPKRGKGGRIPAQGFEITIEAPTETAPKREPAPPKQAKTDRASPKPVPRVPKKKGQKLSEEEQKILAEWEAFERELVRKRKMEQKQLKVQGRARSSTLSEDQVAQLQGNSGQTDQRTRRALSVSDGLALAAQKSIQRKERSKRASDQLKELKTELQELRTELKKEQEQGEGAKKEAAEGATNGEENAGRLRNWKMHMNDMKGKKREDYVSFYKTISKKAVEEKEGEEKGEQVEEKADSGKVKESKSKGPAEVIPVSDSFVHYYLALGGNTDSGSGGKSETRSGGRKEGKAVVQAPPGGGSKQKAVDSRENLVSYYLALRA